MMFGGGVINRGFNRRVGQLHQQHKNDSQNQQRGLCRRSWQDNRDQEKNAGQNKRLPECRLVTKSGTEPAERISGRTPDAFQT